ncbi:MAG: hypothetical protein JW730_06995 [Anaerolineales bacterium]|nr:hypothetical protein [Anaerolineales bacterium]
MKLRQLFNRILDATIVITFLLAMAVTVIGLSLITPPGPPDIYLIV